MLIEHWLLIKPIACAILMAMNLNAYLNSRPRGGKAAFAKAVGVPATYIYQLEKGLRRVPPGRVLAIEAATDHRVSRHELRPDLYPKEPWCRCPACELEQAQAHLPAPGRREVATPPDHEEAA